MLLSYNELIELQRSGVIENSKPEHVNGVSIDLTLGNNVWVEYANHNVIVNLAKKESIQMKKVDISVDGINLRPGQFILAESEQVFNLPNNLAAQFVLKSSPARSALDHAMAGLADPCWHGSVLTFEFKNNSQYHWLRLEPGMKVGQMKFFRVEPVPHEHSYAVKGQYNKNMEAQPSKGIR
jgi:dCTP deaminase